MVAQLMITAVMMLMFICGSLTIWVYRSILRPLSKLQEATRKIRDGNLDFTLDIEEDDEIGELCQDFEEMRIRLKESAEQKIQYDNENKDRLIDELTFYSKIDTNKIPYTFSKINVNSYFRDCAEEVGLDMESRGIELGYFNYVNEDVEVIADAEQMKRVINNIISNSVKYLDKPKGIINIRIKDVGDFIQVEIEDNGRGIATKDLPYIFDRFYRTDSSRNSSKGGSGIGLSIVKKIIEDHGGRIWATSKEGIGTEMHFVLRKYQEVIQNEQQNSDH